MRAHRFSVIAAMIVLALSLSSPRAARADERSTLALLYVGVPLVDGAIGVGGMVTLINTSVDLSERGARPSPAWRTMSWVFGGLNTALAIGWSATSGQLGWYAAMPALTHGVIGIVNLALAGRSLARERSGPRIALVPLVTADRSQVMGGIGLTVMDF